MKKISETILFFGSGPVAAASLECLAKNFQIEHVITKQSPPHHRGLVPVVETAQKLALPITFANTRAELDGVLYKAKFISKVGVIVDYGVIVSQSVIDAFPLGIVNSHFSLLPEWRGADPITFTVLSGQPKTGVSLMVIVEALDEGQLIAQEEILVDPATTTPVLTEQLITKSDAMLRHYLPDYMSGKIVPYNQPHKPATYSRKLTKDDGIIDWAKPAQQLEREIRAFSGWPKSSTNLAGKTIIITSGQVTDGKGSSGTILEKKKRLVIACGENALEIIKLKPAGKQEMTGEAFLAGHSHLL